MVIMMNILRVYCLETHWDSGNCIIRRVAVTSVTDYAWVGLKWSGVHVIVVGWMFGGIGCHATSKGAELSCELDYAISFWLCILSWEYPNFVEVSTFPRYYPHSVDLSVFCGFYPHFVEISIFCWYYPHFVEISTSVDIIRILWILPALATLQDT